MFYSNDPTIERFGVVEFNLKSLMSSKSIRMGSNDQYVLFVYLTVQKTSRKAIVTKYKWTLNMARRDFGLTKQPTRHLSHP